MTKKLRELTTEREIAARLVRERKPRRRVILCKTLDGGGYYLYGDMRLPRCLNRLWRRLAQR